MTKLHPSAPVILGFPWLCSTNPCINWPTLTLRLDWDNPTDSRLVPFDVLPLFKNSKTMIKQFRTPPQLYLRSSLPSSTVAPLAPLSAVNSTSGITQYHDNTITLDNELQFQAQFLITQLSPLTPIVLGLLWLQDINPNINWKNFTVQFPGSKASLVAAIPLHLQSISDPNASNSSTSTSGATQSPSTSDSNPEGEENTTPPWAHNTPTSNAQPLQTTLTQLLPPYHLPVNSKNLDIKIISAIPFAHILQASTPAFQLQIMPALPEECLHAETTMLEYKMEEQILYEVVPPDYHEFADMFSEGSAKELPPHCSYNYKIDLKEGALPPFGKIYNMSKVKLQALKEYLDNMLGKGFIHLLISATSAPVLFTKKKDRSL
ncbi:hypothetical protein E4T56_gene20311 [Termitomyces sp. T112]|nr:hypothetical protein E4T56_gene20311 [Termitomyces sp. T112]